MQSQRVGHNWAAEQQEASINTLGRTENVSQDLAKGLADMMEGETSGEVGVSIQKNGNSICLKSQVVTIDIIQWDSHWISTSHFKAFSQAWSEHYSWMSISLQSMNTAKHHTTDLYRTVVNKGQ